VNLMPRLYLYAAVALAIVLSIVGARLWLHHYGAVHYSAGAASVQTRWDTANARQAAAVAAAQAEQAAHATVTAANFDALAAHYQAQAHAHTPSLADALPAGLAAGAFRLRNDSPAVCPGGAPAGAAATRSHELDAAATQALADRTATAIAAVRLGDVADARERQLGAQVKALQGVLEAERR